MHFKLVFLFVDLFYDRVFHFMYMFILPNFKIYMYTPWVICFSCKSLYIDSIVFRDMYVYFLCWQIIHIPWNEICFNENLIIHVFMISCLNFMYMSILSKLLLYIYILWATCLHAYIFVDSLCLDMYVYFSLYRTYIYLED